MVKPPLWVVDVAVALTRPPREDRWHRIVLAAPDPHIAEVDALHWASRHHDVVMPVRSAVAGRLDCLPDPVAVAALTARLRAAVDTLRGT